MTKKCRWKGNSVDPDQTAPPGSGSACLLDLSVYKKRKSIITSCLSSEFHFLAVLLAPIASCNYVKSVTLFEPCYEKTGYLHMRKQRRRSAAQ